MSDPIPRLHYGVHQGDGPALLLVHGFLSSGAQWLANLDGMKAFSTPIVVDLWGHGRSPAPADPAFYSAEAYLAAFENIREAIGVSRWVICGASFGAGLTLQYAVAHADRIERQIFTNSMSGLSKLDGSAEERETRARAIETGGRAVLAEMPFHPRFARRLAPAVMEGLSEDAERLSSVGIANAVRATSPTLSAESVFPTTTVPTLLINGKWERAFQPLRDRAAQMLPALQIVELEGGHSINAEAPDAFNSALRSFIVGR